MPNNKVIVKVGIKSALQLRDVKVYRAITVQELQRLSELNSDANIVIIEHVYESEYDSICSFLREFIKLENNQVFFFVPDNDDNTTGVADELALDIYLELKDLYHAIKVNCGLNVDPDISIARKDIAELLDDSDDPFNSDFETFEDAIEAVGQSVNHSLDVPMELPEIRSKEETDLDLSDEELGIYEEGVTGESGDTEEAKIESSTSTAEEVNSHLGIRDEPIVIDKNAIDSGDTIQNISAELVDNDNQQSDNNIASNEISKYNAELKNELSKTKDSLNEITSTLDSVRQQLKISNEQVDNLNKVVKSVKDERDSIQAELMRLETAPLIKDPATLEEYDKLRDRLVELEGIIENSSSATSEEVEQLKSNISLLEEKVTNLEQIKVELNNKNAELEIKQAELEQQLLDAKSDSSKDDRIAELTGQVSELSTEIDELKDRVNSATKLIIDKDGEIDTINAKWLAEKASRLDLYGILNSAFSQLMVVGTLREQLKLLRSTNDSLNNEVINLRVSLDDARETNTRLKNEADTRVDIAKNYAREETESTRRENIAIKAQLDIIRAQLMAKETQYNSLVQTTGIDENGAVAVIENNKTLEALNSNLRSQLAELKTAYEMSEREKIEARQAVDTLRDQKEKLSRQIKVISTGYSGGASVGVIPSIAYQGRGQIIVVTGSGSYGITTTAVSTANNLAAQSRVLFIDFDMISAKADSWFKMTPIIQGLPDMSNRSERNTGLGLLIERGAQYFIGYSNSIIRRVNSTKNGWLDYVSGLYDKPDVVKLVATDFTAFLNFCGNNYDYVVVDFGRLGASDINNQMLRIFSDIAKSTVIVSCSDKIDIRNTRIELQRTRINMERAAWLVNLAENTKLDETSKNHLSPASAMVMPFVSDFYGQRKDFSKDRVSRDKFNVFVEKSIFRR